MTRSFRRSGLERTQERPEVAFDQTIGLDEIAQAFARMRTGAAGRTIIRL
jgi:Zn-dependent alcohol dehydrogenase